MRETIREVMTPDRVTVEPSAPLTELAQRMEREDIGEGSGSLIVHADGTVNGV